MQKIARELLRKVDQGISNSKLLEEIGKLSCDELAVTLLLWHQRQRENEEGSSAPKVILEGSPTI
jgi:hypothetical protein